LKTEAVEALPAPTTRLGNWYANLVNMGSARLVLCISERTLLPVLVHVKSLATLPQRLPVAVGEMLRTIGVPENDVAAELDQMSDAVVAKTASRQILGSMNDFGRLLEGYWFGDPKALVEVALKIADAPCRPIGMDNPRDATLAIFKSGDGLRPVRW